MKSCTSPSRRLLLYLVIGLAVFAMLSACGAAGDSTSELEFVDPPGGDPFSDAAGSTLDVGVTSDSSGPGVADTIEPLPDTVTEPPLDTAPDGAPLDVAGPSDTVATGDTVQDATSVSDVTSPEDGAAADDAGPGEDAAVGDATSDVATWDTGGPVEDTEGSADASEVSEDAVGPDTTEVEGCTATEDCPVTEQTCGVSACVDGACVVTTAPLGTLCAAPLGGADVNCVQGSCDVDGLCVTKVLSGVACDDGNACTAGEVCGPAGLCSGGTLHLCPFTGPCELGLCDPEAGCVPFAVADGLHCDDADPCTIQTVCDAGTCGGGDNLCTCLADTDCYEDGDACNGTPACVDLAAGGKGCQTVPETVVICEQSEDPCVKLVCAPASGACTEEVQAGASCDDADACTHGDTCDDLGGCVGVAILCDDGVPCTGDQCEGGLCVFPSLDGATCNDGDPCTVQDVCLAASCAGVAKTCDDGNVCTVDVCTSTLGLCTNAFDDGVGCDDGSACTEADICGQGVCLGAVVSCDDDNVCTDDACDLAIGCVATPNTSGCPDGDLCTGPDLCDHGGCLSAPVVCDDEIPCTVDACAPDEGCVHQPDNGACDDDNPCTTDKCLPGEGCIFVPHTLGCDDGSLCTFDDVCAGGVCAGQVILCNDGLDCTHDTCDLETGACESVVDDVLCDDANPCTVTGCELDAGCVTMDDDGADCDDEVSCTEGDVCGGGLCAPGPNICPCQVDEDCDDDDLCNGVYTCQGTAAGLTECVAVVEPVVCSVEMDTACLTNTCHASSGVCGMAPVTDGAPCPDSDACTSDEGCVAGACEVTEVLCDDDVPCTLDTCAAEVGCVHTPSQSDCDDDVDCTVDACLVLTGCIHEPDSHACSDDVACTVDTCAADTGCEHLAGSGSCDDGVDCTLDVCDLETGCFSVLDDAECDDGNPCTAEVCLNSGCASEEVEGTCEDGNLCTTGDVCEDGACQSGSPIDCEDHDPCTKNTCSQVDGACLENAHPTGTPCEDGSLCTELDYCEDGVCFAGVQATCDDALACTKEACEPDTGCAYTANDGDCDDLNPCTADLCVLGQGCVHEPVTDFSVCDDGVNGTSPDVCVSGLCRGAQSTSVEVPTLWCQIASASFVKVSTFEGSVYALMNYRLSGILCGTVACPEGGGYCHSRVLHLDGLTATGIANLGGVLSGLSYDAVVGQSGQVGQIASSGFNVSWAWSDLSLAITTAGLAGGSWSDVWGTPLPDGAGTSYTFTGRTSADGPGRVIQCRLDDSGSSCGSVLLDFDEWGWDVLHPEAVSGTLSGGVPLAAVAVQGTTAESPSGLWVTQDSDEFELSPLGPNLTVHDVLRPSVDSVWLFGADDLVASLDPDGWTTWSPPTVGLSLHAATTFGHTLVAVGDNPETEEAWLVTLDLEADPEDPESWRVVSLGEGHLARDVHASTKGLTIVGAAIQANGSTRPHLWYLEL